MLDWIRRRLPWLSTPLAVHERVDAVGGGPLSSSITLAAFLSLFPLLLVGDRRARLRVRRATPTSRPR